MNNKIAVLLDEEQQLTRLADATFIYIYEKKSEWEMTEMISTKDFVDERENNIKNFTLALIEKLKCCKVIVGTLILGVPYYLLIRAGYELCEAPAFSVLLLEQLYEDYCNPLNKGESKQDRALEKQIEAGMEPDTLASNISRTPIPLDESGHYFIDLIAVQKAYPEMSSKKLLLPFFSHTLFESLKINCSHIMPWLKDYLEQRNLIAHINREQGKYVVLITHKLCLC